MSNHHPRRAPWRSTLYVSALVTGLALCLVSAPAHAGDARFALIIGHNLSDDPDLAPLRYADDDALRYAELFGAEAEETVLLTTFDAETRTLLGDRAPEASTPTRAAVADALRTLQRGMDAARARGERPVLVFTYSGHGSYDAEGRGFVHLADGHFTTRDLFHQVLEGRDDVPIVLVIDACNAALMVNTRGAGERRPARPSKLRLEDHPNVGLILASSTAGETHEWGRYLAGIFSHEVRSALVGPADLDDDQRVTFAEVAAFVAAANARVTNPNVRVTPYIRPPLTDPDLALVDLSSPAFSARVRVDARLAGKTYAVDGDLVRYADFNASFDARAGFWLVRTRPTELVIVHDDREYVVPEATHGDVSLDALEPRVRTVLSARGAGSAYFDRTLFHEPYGRDFAQHYIETYYIEALVVERVTFRPWYENATAWSLVGGGVGALLTGVGLQLHTHSLARDGRGSWADERQALNDDIDTYQTTATVLYGVGGAALVTGVLLFTLEQPTEVETWRPPLEVELTGNGVRLRADW